MPPLPPPTAPDLVRDETRPYFLWWTDVTVGRLRQLLASTEAEEHAYWLGALLREANSRDVWLFTSPDDIRPGHGVDDASPIVVGELPQVDGSNARALHDAALPRRSSGSRPMMPQALRRLRCAR